MSNGSENGGTEEKFMIWLAKVLTWAVPSSWARSCLISLDMRWKGQNRAYATGADVLEDLATIHDLPKRVLDWRQLQT